jgi:hypothetical protein
MQPARPPQHLHRPRAACIDASPPGIRFITLAGSAFSPTRVVAGDLSLGYSDKLFLLVLDSIVRSGTFAAQRPIR